MSTHGMSKKELFIPTLYLMTTVVLLFGLGSKWQMNGGLIFVGGQAMLTVWLWAKYVRQKRTEALLRQREQLLKDTMNKVPIAISCADKACDIIFNNEKFVELFGYVREDSANEAWMEKLCPDEAKTDEESLWQGMVSEYVENKPEIPHVIPHEFICRCSDGTTKAMKFRYFSDGGHSYAVFDDITECAAIEDGLHRSREILSLAAELAHLGPWEYHFKEGVFEFGDEFYAIYGTDVAREGSFMTTEDYVREFVHPEDVWRVDEEISKAFSTTEHHYSSQMEHRIIRRDGKIRTIAVHINIIRNSVGSIVKWYGANQDITERKQAEEALRQKTEQIRHLAHTDALTGLPNRTHLNERLAGEMEKACRGESAGGVLFIDLDELKTVNDIFGHTYGDAIIKEAGKRIAEETGHSALVGRLGGDEFFAILPEITDRQSIARIAGGIIKVLAEDMEVLGERFHMSASVGAALYPDDGDTAEEVFKNADNAMYAAKTGGKNCWRFYDADMQAKALEKMQLTKSLRQAIERKELSLVYQPQVGVIDGNTAGFEALLRWHSPEHGTISPTRFIPLAEQHGLIHSIGNWVIREACRFARRLADKGWSSIYVSVNVSPYQLSEDCFISQIQDALHEAGILPQQLQIEITENALIASLKDSVNKLRELHAMGVRVALDDFGKGYSSLTYLQRLPVTTLKIDKSFTDMIMMEGSRKEIIRSIVEMAHFMDMSVVAEGVEEPQQIKYLAKCRCDFLQGYFISRPISAEQAFRSLYWQ